MITFDFDFIKKLLSGRPKPRIQPTTEATLSTFEEAVDFVIMLDSPTFTGMTLRNGLGLWNKESALSQHMVQRFGLCHADDTGMLISLAATAKVQRIEYDIDADVQRCKDHWISVGLDPATMERIIQHS
jgi:hypothetical protein